jgi:hypothetical protein
MATARRNVQLLALLAAACVATVPAACQTGPDGNFVTNTEIAGPSSIAPGETATYSVTERLSDGTTRKQASAVWTSSDPSLVQITSSGVATAQPRTGEVVITVKTGVTRAKEVLVLPAGTFRLVGQVIDQDLIFGLADAQVEVTGGPAVRTDAAGGYRLYGVPANAEIRVTRHGYQPLVQRIQLEAHSTRIFPLVGDGTAVGYTGDYTLTVNATCAVNPNPLASELRQRSYAARILQTGMNLEVRLTEPRFLGGHNQFRGNVTSTGAEFRIDYIPYYSHPDVTERLPDGSILLIYGTAVTRGSPAGLSGAFSGGFQHNPVPPAVTHGFCFAATFSLSPK